MLGTAPLMSCSGSSAPPTDGWPKKTDCVRSGRSVEYASLPAEVLNMRRLVRYRYGGTI